MLIGTIYFYLFNSLSLTLNSWLHFLEHFPADPDEISYTVEAVQLYHTDTTFD